MHGPVIYFHYKPTIRRENLGIGFTEMGTQKHRMPLLRLTGLVPIPVLGRRDWLHFELPQSS